MKQRLTVRACVLQYGICTAVAAGFELLAFVVMCGTSPLFQQHLTAAAIAFAVGFPTQLASVLTACMYQRVVGSQNGTGTLNSPSPSISRDFYMRV